MVNVNDLSPPSNSLKAADLEGQEWDLTIESYIVREFDQEDQKTGEQYKAKKPIFSFHEIDKTWVCPKTCRDELASAYGDEMDDWIGKKITLYPTKVPFGNKSVDAIRVRAERQKAALTKKPKPRSDDLDDEIPF
jgi:rubredoxin